jgi:hypothetical protein
MAQVYEMPPEAMQRIAKDRDGAAMTLCRPPPRTNPDVGEFSAGRI